MVQFTTGADINRSWEWSRKFDVVEIGECFHNCSVIVSQLKSERFRYTEGFCVMSDTPIPFPHAWITDVYGNIIDPTYAKRLEHSCIEEMLDYRYFPAYTLDVNDTRLSLKRSMQAAPDNDGMLTFPLFKHLYDVSTEWRDNRYAYVNSCANLFVMIDFFSMDMRDETLSSYFEQIQRLD